MRTFHIRVGSTILDEIEKVYQVIARRVYEKHLDRRPAYSLDIEDWLAAEKELVSKPEVQVIEKADLFVVRVTFDLIDPTTVDILTTSEDVLIQSNPDSHQRRIFRAVHFPLPINPFQLHGTYVEGKLVLIAPKVMADNRFDPVSRKSTGRPMRAAR